jgi:two-component system KDP operon response regulator KdpE
MRSTSGLRRAARHRTALIVEDEDALRTSLAGLLEDEGFEVMTASTVERARYILFESRHPVGVLVLDLAMPDGDGAALLAEMHQRDEKSVPTVLVSASPLRVSALAAQYGIPCITKPFELQQVAAAVAVSFDNDVRPQLRAGLSP